DGRATPAVWLDSRRRATSWPRDGSPEVCTAAATTVTGGAATFTGLTINGAAGDYTLRFESSPLTPATSGTITLSAGTATQLTIKIGRAPWRARGEDVGAPAALKERDGGDKRER